MLPDIDHIVEILIDAAFPEGIPEYRFMRPGGAGGHDHTVKTFPADGVRYFLSRIRGAGKKLFPGMNHMGKAPCIIHNGRNIHHPSDIGPTMTHKNPDSGLFLRHIPFFGIYPFPG